MKIPIRTRELYRRILSPALAILTLTLILPAIAAAQTITYTNGSLINVPNNAVASTYPSAINVSGGVGVITNITVTLTGVSESIPSDLHVVLVGPTGVKVALTQARGGTIAVTNQNWSYDDRALDIMPTTSGAGGTFMPSGGTALMTGGPALPYSSQLSSFIGTNANGTWNLYARDASILGTGGSIGSGWSMTISYGQVFTSTAAITVPGTGAGPAVAAPYPAPITVSGLPTSLISKVTVRLNTISHTYSDDVAILLVGPGGQTVQLLADSGGAADLVGNYIFDSTATKGIANTVSTTAVTATTYLPSIGSGTDSGGSTPMLANYPAPAPASPYGTNLNAFNVTQPNGTWNLYIYDDTTADSGTIANWSLILDLLTPTAAPVDLGGRVLTSNGQGIRGVYVTVQGGDLAEPRFTMTSTFGRYSFSGLTAGQSYVVSIGSKRYIFEQPARVVNLDDNISDLDFIASP